MKNLLKNTLRNLRNNKVTIIALTFLTFLAICVFTLLSSTTTNINNEYKRVSENGKIHSLTINEKYDVGNINYTFIGTNGNEQSSWFSNDNSVALVGYDANDKLVSWGDVSGSLHTYRMELDITNLESNQLAYLLYNNVINQSSPWTHPLYDYVFPRLTVSSSYSYTYQNGSTTFNSRPKSTRKWESVGDEANHTIRFELNESNDLIAITNTLKEKAMYLSTYIADTYSPMKEALENNYSSSINFRSFKSIDINNSPDGVFYKPVVSHNDSTLFDENGQIYPGDMVDKMTIFSGTENFSNYDWQIPGLHKTLDNGISKTPTLQEILSYKVPSTRPSTNTEEWKKTINKFIVLSKGKGDASRTTTGDTDFNKLASNNWSGSDYLNYVFLQNTESYYYKGYRHSFNWVSGAVPHAWYIDDWTAKFTIIAPQYAKTHNIVPFDFSKLPDEYKPTDLTKLGIINYFNSMDQVQSEKWYDYVSNNYDGQNGIDNLINIGGGTPYIVLGTGITADFLYPIVSIERATPNTSKECIVFLNDSGFDRIYDSFRANPTDMYIVARIIDNTDINRMIEKLETLSRTFMNWPSNIKCVYGATDTNNHLSAAAFRISFVPSLISTIALIDYILTGFILVICIVVATTIIKRYVESNRVNIGVVQANGVSKRKIAFSLLPFGLIPSFIGCIAGYICGLFLQQVTLKLLSSYWTLPTPIMAFDYVALGMMLCVPLLLFFLVSIICTYWVLRVKTTYLMKSGSEYRTNLTIKYIKKPFQRFGIITRFRVALAFNSIWRLIVLTSLTSMAVTSVVFAITINKTFDTSINKTNENRNYTYAIDLFTPTEQAGQYIPTDATKFAESGWITTQEGTNLMPNVYYQNDKISMANVGDSPATVYEMKDSPLYQSLKAPDFNGSQLSKTYYDLPSSQGVLVGWYQENDWLPDINTMVGVFGTQPTNPAKMMEAMGKNTNTVYPSGSDAVGQAYDLMYMKNRTITKTVLDYSVGSTETGYSNPWDYAISLMPENQKNQINSISKQIIQLAGMKANPVLYNSSVKRPSINLPGYVASKYIGQNSSMGGLNNYYSINSTNNDWITKDYAKYFTLVTRDENNNEISDFIINQKEAIDSFVVDIGLHVDLPPIDVTIKYVEGKTGLKPDYIKFLNKMYEELEWPYDDYSLDNINKINNNDYQIRYNQVPLQPALVVDGEEKYRGDETYTYVDVSGTKLKNKTTSDSARILGIKPDSKYITLKNGKTDITNRIFEGPNGGVLPIVINRFTAYKYGLKNGNKFDLDINNSIDRYTKQLSNDTSKIRQKFKVVGICDTYINEEYYISQDNANYILGLKSHLLDNNITTSGGGHSYYPDGRKSIQIAGENLPKMREGLPIDYKGIAFDFGDLSSKGNWNWHQNDISNFPLHNYKSTSLFGGLQKLAPDGLPYYNTNTNSSTAYAEGVTYDVDNLYDLNEPIALYGETNRKVTNRMLDKNITPYGFNGVFTDREQGNPLLRNFFCLYSPSGIYPGNDRLSTDTMKGILEYGANMQIVNQISQFWISENNPKNTPLGNKIYKAWRRWMYDGNNIRKDFKYTDPAYIELQSYRDELITQINNVFGNNSYLSLVENAADKTTTQLVFKNLASTITQIEYIVIATIIIMVSLIILLLTMIIVTDAKRLGGILKALGYRDHVNIMSFLAIYFPVILFSMILSIPLTIGLLYIYQLVIANAIGILLSVNAQVLVFLAAWGGTVGCFTIFGYVGYLNLKKDKVTDLIKWA